MGKNWDLLMFWECEQVEHVYGLVWFRSFYFLLFLLSVPSKYKYKETRKDVSKDSWVKTAAHCTYVCVLLIRNRVTVEVFGVV